MVDRSITPELLELADSYPVVAVVGPRQSGKTTLCRAAFPDHAYVSLEDPDVRRFATDDPRGFLDQYGDRAVFDEIQRAPELPSYLQRIVDERQVMGQFVLTGSSQLDVMAGVTQSLAGRAALVELLPFSLAELERAGQAPETLESLLFQGLYPPVHDRELDPSRWHANYVRTYVERDVRQLINVQDLNTFQEFIRLCAGRTGQLLNLSSLGGDVGISHNTAKAWISALEASFLVHRLRPYHANFGKRALKTPKLYMVDVGLACWLLGIENPDQLRTHPLRGALFETWVISELLKARFNRGHRSNLYFWRDRRGLEVDALIDQADGFSLIEVKSGRTVPANALKSVRAVRGLSEGTPGDNWMIYGGDQVQQRSDATILGWRELAERADAITGAS